MITYFLAEVGTYCRDLVENETGKRSGAGGLKKSGCERSYRATVHCIPRQSILRRIKASRKAEGFYEHTVIVYQSSMIFKVVILSAPFPTTVIQSIFLSFLSRRAPYLEFLPTCMAAEEVIQWSSAVLQDQ